MVVLVRYGGGAGAGLLQVSRTARGRVALPDAFLMDVSLTDASLMGLSDSRIFFVCKATYLTHTSSSFAERATRAEGKREYAEFLKQQHL